MANVVIGNLKINSIHSGAVLNIGDFIFSMPSNDIELTTGNNSLCSGDGMDAITQIDEQDDQDLQKAKEMIAYAKKIMAQQKNHY